MQKWEIEKKRLDERIALIRGTDLSTSFNRHRREVNKLGNINARGAKFRRKVNPVTGIPMEGNRAWVAYDEIERCHEWLDQHGIATCNFHDHIRITPKKRRA